MNDKTLVLVDGENLVHRYESMVKDGRTPKDDVIHRPGAFLWHKLLCRIYTLNIFRVSYYSTFVGDNEGLEELSEYISKVPYSSAAGRAGLITGTINPHLFKKTKRSTKVKSVDISITIDALRHCYNRDVHRIILCSGDGDYQPLINELMGQGIMVHVAAFSNGCHPKMKYIADDFKYLDEVFFQKIT